jgi:hypothetical protein
MMKITIQTNSGKNFKVEPRLSLTIDATNLDEHSWQYAKDHAQLQRLDGKHELGLYIGNNTEHLDELVRNIIEYGCSQDLVELIELCWNHHVTWLMLYR